MATPARIRDDKDQKLRRLRRISLISVHSYRKIKLRKNTVHGTNMLRISLTDLADGHDLLGISLTKRQLGKKV